MVAIRELTKIYGSTRAVNGLAFEVAPAEIVGLIGPNGAGKTSTLRSFRTGLRWSSRRGSESRQPTLLVAALRSSAKAWWRYSPAKA
jgi:ATPase subunit of ABC transporter with duplicated ATPase domains